MRWRAAWTVLVIGAAWLAGIVPGTARAQDPGPAGVEVIAPAGAGPAPAPAAGTAEEEEAYARREAASPEAREFVGGDGVVVVVLLVGIFVLAYLLLKKEGRI
jgi:hypothetical protein